MSIILTRGSAWCASFDELALTACKTRNTVLDAILVLTTCLTHDIRPLLSGGNVFTLRKLSAVALAIPMSLGGVVLLAAPGHAAGISSMEAPPPPPPDSMRPPTIGAPAPAGNAPYTPPDAPAPVAPVAPAPGGTVVAPVMPPPAAVPGSANNLPVTTPGQLQAQTPSGNTDTSSNTGSSTSSSSGQSSNSAAIDAANEAAAHSSSTPNATASASPAATKVALTEAQQKAAKAAEERAAVSAANRAKESASPSASPTESETQAAYTPKLNADQSSQNTGIDSGLIVLIATLLGIVVVGVGAFFVWKKMTVTKQAVDPRRRMNR